MPTRLNQTPQAVGSSRRWESASYWGILGGKLFRPLSDGPGRYDPLIMGEALLPLLLLPLLLLTSVVSRPMLLRSWLAQQATCARTATPVPQQKRAGPTRTRRTGACCPCGWP